MHERIIFYNKLLLIVIICTEQEANDKKRHLVGAVLGSKLLMSELVSYYWSAMCPWAVSR